jgi:hypothetical protein
MPMMEVVVGTAVGAVAGSGLTIFTAYVQMRMKRGEGHREIIRGQTDGLWHALHEGQQQLIAQRHSGTGQRSEFDAIVMQLARKIRQQVMVVGAGGFNDRLSEIEMILEELAQARSHRDDELFQIANDLIIHAQWVCAALLMNERLPEEIPRLREYRAIFDHP